MLVVFTGNGKGKTTAALGQAVRAVGEGRRVLMIQFIKGPWKSGEDEVRILPAAVSQTNEARFKLVKLGRGFVGILGDRLAREEHARAAAEALDVAEREVASGAWQVLILDEINNAMALELLPVRAVLAFIDRARQKLEHLILTGRDAPPEILALADLVTEMRDCKHPFAAGIKARRGLEY